MMTSLQRRRYMPNLVLRVTQMRFFPSACADRGPVAEDDVGTVGNGRGGTSLRIRALDDRVSRPKPFFTFDLRSLLFFVDVAFARGTEWSGDSILTSGASEGRACASGTVVMSSFDELACMSCKS